MKRSLHEPWGEVAVNQVQNTTSMQTPVSTTTLNQPSVPAEGSLTL